MSYIFGNSSLAYDEIPAIEGYGIDDAGSETMIFEAYEDQLAVMEAIHTLDANFLNGMKTLRTLEESSADEDEIENAKEELERVTEASVKEVFKKIKDFIVNLFKKIGAFIQSALMQISAWTKDAKSFAEKYKDKLNKLSDANLKNLDIQGYKFDLGDVSSLADGGKFDATPFKTALDNLNKLDDSNADTDADDMINGSEIGQMFKELEDVDISELQKEAYDGFRGGGNKVTITINKSRVSEAIKFLSSDAASLKLLKDKNTKLKRDYANNMAIVKQLEDSYNKNGNKYAIKVANKLTTFVSKMQSMGSIAMREAIKATREAISQEKKICVTAFSKGSQAALKK